MRMLAASVITTLVVFAFGVFGFFTLLVGLNGVSESKAVPIFIGYFVLLVLVVAGFALLSAWGVNAFSKLTAWPAWAAVPVVVVSASALSAVTYFFGVVFLTIVLGVK